MGSSLALSVASAIVDGILPVFLALLGVITVAVFSTFGVCCAYAVLTGFNGSGSVVLRAAKMTGRIWGGLALRALA